jgi:hypothetical protein
MPHQSREEACGASSIVAVCARERRLRSQFKLPLTAADYGRGGTVGTNKKGDGHCTGAPARERCVPALRWGFPLSSLATAPHDCAGSHIRETPYRVSSIYWAGLGGAPSPDPPSARPEARVEASTAEAPSTSDGLGSFLARQVAGLQRSGLAETTALQKAKANAAANRIPQPITAKGTGS